MNDCPITIECEGNIYNAVLSEGNAAGRMWHLMINNYYFGQLMIINSKFCFHGNDAGKKFEACVDQMEDTLIAWYQ
jgi:hypothetical protein